MRGGTGARNAAKRLLRSRHAPTWPRRKLNLDPAGLWPTWLCGLLGGPRETAEFFAESTLAPGVWYVEEDKNELTSS